MTEDQERAVIHTDGACIGNPGPGGWAALIELEGAEQVISGREAATTNDRMELTAAIKALEALPLGFPLPFTATANTSWRASPSGFLAGKRETGAMQRESR